MNKNEIDLTLAAAGYPPSAKSRKSNATKKLEEAIHEAKKIHVMDVMSSLGGHRRRSAEMLGISQRTLYRWLKKWQ